MTVRHIIGRLGRALGVETRLLVSFLTIAAAALVAGGAGLLSFERIESNFEQFAEQRVPALADALLMVVVNCFCPLRLFGVPCLHDQKQ